MNPYLLPRALRAEWRLKEDTDLSLHHSLAQTMAMFRRSPTEFYDAFKSYCAMPLSELAVLFADRVLKVSAFDTIKVRQVFDAKYEASQVWDAVHNGFYSDEALEELFRVQNWNAK